MSRYDHRDILMELLELCREQKADILQQLNYYRASVYKTETATIIERKVNQLQIVAALIGDEVLLDAFHDYAETKANGHLVAPGECLLSTRVMNLLQSCDKIFDQLLNDIHQRSSGDRQIFTRLVQKHRTQLLSMCRQGTRQWSFFSSI